VILDVPWGWVSLHKAHKSSVKKKPNRRLFSQNILQKRDEIELDWVYLFDLDDRTLTISAAADTTRDGTAPKPYAVVNFSDRGRPDPRQIVPPPPIWPTMPVAAEWEGDLEESAPLRQRALEVTDGWCARVGLPHENLSTLIGAALSSVVATALGTEVEKAYIPAPHGEGQAYWTVQLYDTTLHYPSPAWRDAMRQNDAMYSGDSIELWAGPTRSGKTVLSPKRIVTGYEDLPWSEALPEQEETVAAVLRGIAAGVFPRSDIDSEGLRIFRWMKVCEEVEDPDREVRVSAQNETEIGAEVQNTLLLKWGWDVLDWLRASQLTEREPVEYVEEEYEDEEEEEGEEDEEHVVYVDEDGNEIEYVEEDGEDVVYVDEDGEEVEYVEEDGEEDVYVDEDAAEEDSDAAAE
jgi:hypothetical protein